MGEVEPIESLKDRVPLVEVELMLTADELQRYGQFCIDNNLKFNDWIRSLAHEALKKEQPA